MTDQTNPVIVAGLPVGMNKDVYQPRTSIVEEMVEKLGEDRTFKVIHGLALLKGKSLGVKGTLNFLDKIGLVPDKNPELSEKYRNWAITYSLFKDGVNFDRVFSMVKSMLKKGEAGEASTKLVAANLVFNILYKAKVFQKTITDNKTDIQPGENCEAMTKHVLQKYGVLEAAKWNLVLDGLCNMVYQMEHETGRVFPLGGDPKKVKQFFTETENTVA